jgi:magnesium transporter
VIVDCAVYENGSRRAGELELEEAGRISGRDAAFVWLGVVEPSEEELEAIAREFDLHELAVEDAVKAHQRAKLEVYGDTVFLVLKTTRYVDPEEVVDIGEIMLFVGPGFIVSVRHGEASGLAEVRRAADARGDLLDCGPGAIVHAIVDRVVDDYEVVTDGVEEDIQQVQAQVFSAERTNPAERIYKLEREVLEFQRAVTPLAPAMNRLMQGDLDVVPRKLHEYFRDVHDHLLRVAARVDSFRELLDSALQANLTQVSVRQNEDMRKITAWVAILAVPTSIAGIYGMNFEHMPELEWELGYPLVLAVILVICVFLYTRFKRSGWL